MINIKKLTKKYDDSVIFKDLNLNIEEGKIISIVGPSGSGKSTLLNLISGIDIDYSGEILISETSLGKIQSEEEMTKYRGKNISFIFQNFHLIDNLTVKENIDLIIDINKISRNYSTQEILKLVGLEDKIDQYPFHLSGGEKQRVAIARAFVGDSQILLADEPTGSLDAKNTKKICDLIIKLNKSSKNTIILITHDPEVAKIGHSQYLLENYTLNKQNA